jgi:hypothetical protein
MLESDPGATSTCPGCRLSLPVEPSSPAPRLNASPECWRLYGEVTGTAMSDPVLGGLHQLTVDAYAAQHPSQAGPTITTAFALIGLYLALEEGRSGFEVRAAHQRLAEERRSWPAFRAPADLKAVDRTVLDVGLASSRKEHRDALDRWARAVWNAWHREHETIAALVARPVPPAQTSS